MLGVFRKLMSRGPDFEVDTAFQGQEAVALAAAARAGGRPYAVAFVDIYMPPGWDGLTTIERLWEVDPDLQIAICSSFADYPWEDLCARFGVRDGLLVIKKPFDPIEVVQCMHALATKWRLAREAEAHRHGLEDAVRDRTAALARTHQRLSDEIRERALIEGALRLAQRLEAIGQLAAGVAHEIGTPIQFIGDSVSFVREGLSRVFAMIGAMRAEARHHPGLTAQFDELAAAADLAYLDENLPLAIARMQDGIGRVTAIVRSMKELSHHGSREPTPVDLDGVLRSALQITANSIRYVADVELELQPLPPVIGHLGDLGQAFVNLIVNGVHAMEDRLETAPGRGRLTVRTQVDGDDVVVSIADTGTGIPDAVRDRIFDAFYTTKAVGRGTGQGLAIATRIVVGTHGGALTFDTAIGVGTTFHVRLPIAGAPGRDR